MFATRVLYVIAVMTQNFFCAAQQGNLDLTLLSFSWMQDDIVQNRNFSATLPSFLIEAKKCPREDNCGEVGDHNDKRGKAPVKDPNANPEWSLSQGKSYRLIFQKNREHMPSRNPLSPPVWKTFQIRGSCYIGCRFDHDKINRNTPLHTTFSKWCSDCRAQIF